MNEPLSCMQICDEVRYVKIKKQVAICSSCKAKIDVRQHPIVCPKCNQSINWRGFTKIADEIIKLYAEMPEGIDENSVK